MPTDPKHILTDITDRKQVEEALKESEERYRVAVEGSIDGVVIVQNDLHAYVNKAFLDMFGYRSPDEIVGTSRYCTIHQDDHERVGAYSSARLKSEHAPAGYEFKGIKKDGTAINIEVSANIISYRGEKAILAYLRDITERKRAGEALKQSEATLRSLIDATKETVLLIDTKGAVMVANETVAGRLGTSVRDLIGTCAYDYFPPELARRRREWFERVVHTGEPVYFQDERAGISYENYGYPVLDEKGTVTAVAIFARGITERKRSEEELGISRNRLSRAEIISRSGNWEFDLESKRVFGSDGARKIYGLLNGEWTIPEVQEIPLPEYRGVLDRALRDLIEEDRPYDVEFKIRRPDTGEIYDIHSVAEHDRRRNVVFGIIQDITERKRAEEALQESEERYRTAIESSNDGITILKGLNVIFVNRKFLETFGFQSPDEIVGQSIERFVHPDDRDRIREMNKRRQRNEDVPDRYEVKGLRKNGEVVYIEVSVTRATYQGEPVTFALLRDISERKSLEAQLLQAQKMEAIGTLAGGVAHDFNNILMALMGYGNLLQMKMDRNDPLRVYVDQILSSTAKAANITQSLLAFGRKQVMEMKPYTITTIVKDIEKLLQRLMPEDIELTIKLGNDTTVMADMTQIDQVLMNLATNARDAMPQGGRLTIETGRVVIDEEFMRIYGYGKPGFYALITVTDTGTGMDEQTQKKIFEPFYTTKEVGKGTGLGLAIVYGIIKQHNGYVNVSSRLGAGTTFLLYLPEVKEKPRTTRTAVREAQGGSETLLLAEDNADIRAITSEILKRSGYTVIEAVNGQDAVERFREHRDEIQLIILDVVMPEKNGKEAYEEIRTMRHDIKALFMSGYTGDVVLDKGVFGKAFDYVAKPISPNELLIKVREALDRES